MCVSRTHLRWVPQDRPGAPQPCDQHAADSGRKQALSRVSGGGSTQSHQRSTVRSRIAIMPGAAFRHHRTVRTRGHVARHHACFRPFRERELARIIPSDSRRSSPTRLPPRRSPRRNWIPFWIATRVSHPNP